MKGDSSDQERFWWSYRFRNSQKIVLSFRVKLARKNAKVGQRKGLQVDSRCENEAYKGFDECPARAVSWKQEQHLRGMEWDSTMTK